MRLVILGGGESGVGTALLGKQKGYDVFVSDFGKIKDNYKEVLNHNAIEWEDETHTENKILNADLVMKSPGIPEKAPIVKKLIEKNIPVISEIEFAAPFTNAKTIGITGSNGKTILKEWLFQLLNYNYDIVRSPKSYNSQVGVPLSVWQMNVNHELAIFEAGISTLGEMEKLEPIINPEIGVFTFLGDAHAEGFESRDQKIKEKQRR